MDSTVAVPRGAILDTWINDPWKNGIQIDKMADMQRVHVRTQYSLYEITVIDGRAGSGAAPVFPELARRMAGATLGGGFCKMRGIYCGFKMEICNNGQRIITSDVHHHGFADKLDDSFTSRPHSAY
jgi:hypothetical protein